MKNMEKNMEIEKKYSSAYRKKEVFVEGWDL